jgi:hypothetical protein
VRTRTQNSSRPALALDEPALSPRELALRFTDTENYFVSEASVYRLLKAHDLIASPAFIVMKAADEFKDKTTAPNELWQTDFTYLKVIGWGWFYLSTVRLVGSSLLLRRHLNSRDPAMAAQALAGLSLES